MEEAKEVQAASEVVVRCLNNKCHLSSNTTLTGLLQTSCPEACQEDHHPTKLLVSTEVVVVATLNLEVCLHSNMAAVCQEAMDLVDMVTSLQHLVAIQDNSSKEEATHPRMV